MLQRPKEVSLHKLKGLSFMPLKSFLDIFILNKDMCTFKGKKPKPQRPWTNAVKVITFEIPKHCKGNVSIPTVPSSTFSESRCPR